MPTLTSTFQRVTRWSLFKVRGNMRAVLVEQYDSIENIQIKEVQTPVPGAGQVLVKVKACLFLR